MISLPSLDEIVAATDIVRRVMPPTPTYCWPLACERTGTELWLKHENHTPVGAFKLRTAAVYIDWLLRSCSNPPGLVAATRGNFGQGIAAAAAQRGLRTLIVVPEGNSPEKNRAMRALGAELIVRGNDFQSAAECAARIALERQWQMIPSFHPMLVHGAATIASELFAAVPPLDTLYLPIGLGSSICGAVAARDALRLTTRIVGVVASASPSYALSFRARRVVAHPAETRIADGVACRVPDAEALEVILRGVERVIEVDDDDIEEAMRMLYEDTHNIVEGAGALAFAGLMRDRKRVAGRRVGAVLTGGNVDRQVFARVLTR